MAPAEREHDLRGLEEWQECRLTIGRFDGLLADTRKYGFTLVTVLLTANALVVSSNNAVDRPAAAVVVMALLFALFMLDNYYWDIVRGAVSRAKDLENENNPKGITKLTGVISERVANSHATELILAVYLVFVLVAMGTGLTAGLAPAASGASTASAAPAAPAAPWGLVLVVLVAVAELVTMGAVFLIVQYDAPPAKRFLGTKFGTRVGKMLQVKRVHLPDPPDVPA